MSSRPEHQHAPVPTTDAGDVELTISASPTDDNDGPSVLSSKLSTTKSKSQHSIRFEGSGLQEAELVWSRINKFVDDSANVGKKKQLLTQISGVAKPGEMTALMGPSGSGKTTLLNILGGRGLSEVTGDVYINNAKFQKSMRKTIAYVLQEDLFFTQLTVREQLTITSHLRLPSTLSDDAKKDAVDNVIKVLRIEKCSNTQIMLISGGEKKRTNIGTELLTNPSIVLLDEPTVRVNVQPSLLLLLCLQRLDCWFRMLRTTVPLTHTSIVYSVCLLCVIAVWS